MSVRNSTDLDRYTGLHDVEMGQTHLDEKEEEPADELVPLTTEEYQNRIPAYGTSYSNLDAQVEKLEKVVPPLTTRIITAIGQRQEVTPEDSAEHARFLAEVNTCKATFAEIMKTAPNLEKRRDDTILSTLQNRITDLSKQLNNSKIIMDNPEAYTQEVQNQAIKLKKNKQCCVTIIVGAILLAILVPVIFY
ncbi:MAG: hypothetical protein KGJ02_05265 [Verrucomicrobiota bacterium]|nr:hypothetical protein [Verrucomicrobiota bacterium]